MEFVAYLRERSKKLLRAPEAYLASPKADSLPYESTRDELLEVLRGAGIGVKRLSLPCDPAAWMAGFACTNLGPDANFRPRPVTVLESRDQRSIALALRSPDIEVIKGPDAGDLRWQALTGELKAIVARNRSTLIFGNSRRSVEKIARLLNADEPEPIAYSHHGSLSREIRLDVEERMKQGRLRAVVATGSLELGIDIGSVEEVVLIGTPPSVAQSLQRIGRANHRVGGTSP